jgi:ABC-type transport system involved in multi-copper enzyme maturation permease subunit
MKSALKAEFRKLFTVRSTYVLCLISLVILGIFAFYLQGLKVAPESLGDTHKLAGEVTNAISTVAIFAALAGVLLVTHEYRYSTIMYSLTSSKSRVRVILAKFIAVSLFTIGFSLAIGILSPLFTYAGISLRGLHLVHQDLHIWDLLWRSVFYGWGIAAFGMVLATIIRNQIGAIIALFVLPGVVEGLAGMLLKHNAIYLPYQALNSLIGLASSGPAGNISASHGKSVLIFLTYLVVGWAISLTLLLRRDAN